MANKIITLTFDLKEVCNDILVQCNLIGQNIHDEAMADIRANIISPDSPETRSIICRAISEAFGKIKVSAQRYITTGRSSDNNTLERIAYDSAILVSEKTTASVQGQNTTIPGEPVDTGDEDNATAHDTYEEIPKDIKYETLKLILSIPNFNTAVTDHLKSMMHKYIVDYALFRFLQDQLPDKATGYKQIAEEEDYRNIVSDLNARERYTRRNPTWI